MKYYDVIALSVGGLRNKIFRVGDRVSEAHFHEGMADKLVEQGFLKFAEETDEKANLQPGAPRIIEKEAPQSFRPEFQEDDVTRKEIIAKLDALGVEYAKNATKSELYELYVKAKEPKK